MITRIFLQTVLATAILTLVSGSATFAQDVVPTRENVGVTKKPYSPYAGRSYPTKVPSFS